MDGDGRVDELTDRTYIGTADPDFFGGITFDFKYRNFDLNMFFQGVFGNQVVMIGSVRVIFGIYQVPFLSVKNHRLDYWMLGRLTNPDSDIPAMTNVMTNNEQRMSTYYIEDGSYLKVEKYRIGLYFSC